jgi:hypothetical protein
MNKIYKKDSKITILFFIIAVVGIFFIWNDKVHFNNFFRIFFLILDIVAITIGFPFLATYSIRIDETGISNLYILGSRILKVRQYIKWENVKGVALATRGTIAVTPKLPPDRLRYKYKDFIIIPTSSKTAKSF